MLNNDVNFPLNNGTKPDYDGLVRFLIEPLLESPELLSFDCESVPSTKRVWIRLAFEENDKGRIYGRGGRNIQAVKTVLETAAIMAGDTLYIEIYDEQGRNRSRNSRPPMPSSSPTKESGEIYPKKPIRRRRGTIKPQF